MAPFLSQNARPHVENFYQNSFRQLSRVQQKQVGLLVGASVADAAVHGLDGLSAADIAAYEREVLSYEQTHAVHTTLSSSAVSASSSLSATSAVHSPLAFASDAMPSARSTALGSAGQLADGFHSFSYRVLFDLLRTMSAARGDFAVHYVADKWRASAAEVARVDPARYAAEQGSLLHALTALLPVPTIYPYASDAAMRAYVQPFVNTLATAPHSLSAAASDGVSAAEVAAAERSLTSDMTLSTLGVLIRHLQSNPDAERNGAFMALPGTAGLFTTDSAPFVPLAVGAEETAAVARRQALCEEVLARPAGALVAHRSTLRDAAVVREGMTIAKSARGFADGVIRAARLGGPVCQRAMLVGAMLGARLGVRQIPLPWLSATVDHQPVATMALEVAQWAWNPPHH